MTPRAASVHGFTLVELLVACAVLSLVMGGVVGFFSSVSRVTRQEEQVSVVETNLRLALDKTTSELRRARYGAPRTMLSSWIGWVSGFDANPLLRQGSGSAPDSISIAACTATPVATLRATLNASADGSSNTVSLRSAVSGKSIADLLNSGSRRLIRFGDGAAAEDGFALVTAVSGSTLTIDTDPGSSGSQGFTRRSYFAGTPVCRVDVTSYTLDAVNHVLKINENQGAGAQPAIDGLTDLQISGAGNSYQLTFTAEAEARDPLTHTPLSRAFTATLTLRNL